MGLFSNDKPKPPARMEEKPAAAPAPAPAQLPQAKAPSLKNTINVIKQRKKMLDEM